MVESLGIARALKTLLLGVMFHGWCKNLIFTQHQKKRGAMTITIYPPL